MDKKDLYMNLQELLRNFNTDKVNKALNELNNKVIQINNKEKKDATSKKKT